MCFGHLLLVMGKFCEKQLQKTNQTEFRDEKVIK